MPKYANPLVPERKQPKEPVYNIPKSQLESMLRAELNKGLHSGVYAANAMYTAAMLFELHDTLGWGQQRLKRIHDRVQKLFASIADRSVNYAEIAQAYCSTSARSILSSSARTILPLMRWKCSKRWQKPTERPMR